MQQELTLVKPCDLMVTVIDGMGGTASSGGSRRWSKGGS